MKNPAANRIVALCGAVSALACSTVPTESSNHEQLLVPWASLSGRIAYSRVEFCESPMNLCSALFVIDAGKQTITTIYSTDSDYAGVVSLAWTSDGRIGYHTIATNGFTPFEVFAIDPSVRKRVHVTTGSYPTWSATGELANNCSLGLCIDGALPYPGLGANGRAAWMPDGVHLIASQSDSTSQSSLYLISITDSAARAALRQSPPPNNREYYTDPAISPDGTHVAYVCHGCGTPSNTSIWVMSVNGTGAVALTTPSDFGESEPAWSPDGTQIAFMRSSSLMVMGADGSGQVPLVAATDVSSVAWGH